MIRTVLVDDEPPARRKLRRLAVAHSDVRILAEASSGEEAVATIRAHAPDLVLLDVTLPDMDGFEVLRRLGSPASFRPVFVTAFDAFAVRAFEVSALDYLQKPVDQRRFDRMIERARASMIAPEDTRPRTLIITDKHRSYHLDVTRIDWIHAQKNYVVIHEGGREHVVRGTLDSFATSLDPTRFPRTSRSHIVHVEAIVETRKKSHGDLQVLLRDGTELPWSRRFRS